MDEVFQFVVDVFGPEALRTVDPAVLTRFALPARSVEYLTTVGLPAKIEAPLNLEFNLLDTLPTLGEVLPPDRFKVNPAWDGCPFLGRWWETMGVYLNAADGGSAWMIDVNTQHEDFLNSGVEMLGWFLAECSRPQPGIGADAPAEVRREGIRAMERRMRAMDPRAMKGDKDAVWPVVIEEALLFA